MSKYSPDTCRRLAEARREQGLTQSALALSAGCKQSAISMFEKGDASKLSDATVEKLAEILGVALNPEPSPQTTGVVHSPAHVHGYCPNCSCPSNVPYEVDGSVIFRPVRSAASPNGGRRCAVCGEVLELACPTCGAPINDGACCEVCGARYVTAVIPEGVDASAWARARRSEIAELKALWN